MSEELLKHEPFMPNDEQMRRITDVVAKMLGLHALDLEMPDSVRTDILGINPMDDDLDLQILGALNTSFPRQVTIEERKAVIRKAKGLIEAGGGIDVYLEKAAKLQEEREGERRRVAVTEKADRITDSAVADKVSTGLGRSGVGRWSLRKKD